MLIMAEAAFMSGSIEAHHDPLSFLNHNEALGVHETEAHPSPTPHQNIPETHTAPAAIVTKEIPKASASQNPSPAIETTHPVIKTHIDQKTETSVPVPVAHIENTPQAALPKAEIPKPETSTYSENIRDIHLHGRLIEGNSEQVLKHYYIKNAEKFGYDPEHKKMVEVWAGRQANRIMHTHRHWNAPVRAHDKVTFVFDKDGNPIERIVERHKHEVNDVKTDVVTETHHHESPIHHDKPVTSKEADSFKEPALPEKASADLSNTGLTDQGLFDHDYVDHTTNTSILSGTGSGISESLENTAQVGNLVNVEMMKILNPIFGEGVLSNLKHDWTEGLARTGARNLIEMKADNIDAKLFGVTQQELFKTKEIIAALAKKVPIQRDELTGDYLMRVKRMEVLQNLNKQN